jgi:hypothetical protein
MFSLMLALLMLVPQSCFSRNLASRNHEPFQMNPFILQAVKSFFSGGQEYAEYFTQISDSSPVATEQEFVHYAYILFLKKVTNSSFYVTQKESHVYSLLMPLLGTWDNITCNS